MSDKELLLKRAKSALISRDYETAARIYKSLIKSDKKNMDLKIQLGNLYVKSGQDSLALSCFEEIEQYMMISGEEFPFAVDVYLSLGGIYRRLGRFDESLAALGKAGETGAKEIQVSYSLGFTYRQMGKYESAIDCFQNVIDKNPRDVLAFNHLGAIHALQGNHEKAIVAYQHGLKIDPNHPVIQLNIAKSYEAIGETKKALSCYEGALRSKPGWIEAIDLYSDLLLKENQVKEADDVVSRALKINPDDVKMHTAMGKVFNRKSVFEDAEKEFKKALSKNDVYAPALKGLALSQEKQGKSREAAETIQKAQKLSPDDIEILKQTAHILLSANYLPAAYEKISHLWKINQDDIDTVNLLGQYYICHGDEDKIEACFDRLERIKPGCTDVYKDWGERYLQIGDEKNAEDYLKVAVHENAGDADAMISLARMYDKQGRTNEALDLLYKAGKADANNESAKRAVDRIERKKQLFHKEPPAPAVQPRPEEGLPVDDFDIFDRAAEMSGGVPENVGEVSMGKEFDSLKTELNSVDVPFDLGMGDGELVENENADFESPIDFDDSAKDDSDIEGGEFDDSKSLENLIDAENDSVDSVLHGGNEMSDSGDDSWEVESGGGNPAGQSGRNSVPADAIPEMDAGAAGDSSEKPETKVVPENGAAPASPASASGSAAPSDAFDFSQFGAEDLSGDTDDIVSIDEMMGDGERDSGDVIDDLVDFDAPVDEEDDVRRERMPDGSGVLDAISRATDYPEQGIEEEVVRDFPREFNAQRPNLFRDEDFDDRTPVKPYAVGDGSDYAPQPPSYNPDAAENFQRQSVPDSRHQPRPVSDDDYLSLERQIQQVARNADDAQYAANQARRAAQFAEENVRDTEGRIKRSLENSIESMVEEKIRERIGDDLDNRIDEKISERIGDDLNNKISETIDNFIVGPDSEPEPEGEIELMNEDEFERAREDDGDDVELPVPDVEVPENALEIVSQNLYEEPEKNEAEKMLEKAVAILPSIVRAIEDKSVMEEFKSSLEMFKKLREMLEFLPPAKKKQFMTSRTRIMLDYVIAKLSGRPGLFATVVALLKSGVMSGPTPTEEITSPIDMDASSEEYIVTLISSVMETLRKLCESLEDDYLRDAIDSEILGILEKIRTAV